MQLRGCEKELEALKAMVNSTIANGREQEHGVQYLSDEYDDLALPLVIRRFRTK